MPVQRDHSRTTEWIYHFADLRELRDWLAYHHVSHPVHQLSRMWDRYLTQGRIYMILIKGSKLRGGRRAEFNRVLPTCQHCGRRLSWQSKPVKPWGPGVRPMFTCEDCADDQEAT